MRLWGSESKDADPTNNEQPDRTDYVSNVIEDANIDRGTAEEPGGEQTWAWRCEISGGVEQCSYELYRPSPQHVEPGLFDFARLSSMARDDPPLQDLFVLAAFILLVIQLFAWLCGCIGVVVSELERRRFERQVPDSYKHPFELPTTGASQRKREEKQQALNRRFAKRDESGIRSILKKGDERRDTGDDSVQYYNKIRWLEARRLLWEKKRLAGISCEYPGAYPLDDKDDLWDDEICVALETIDDSRRSTQPSAPPPTKTVLSGRGALSKDPWRPAPLQSTLRARLDASRRALIENHARKNEMMRLLNSTDEQISIYPDPCQVLSTNPQSAHNITATLPYLWQSYDRPLYPEKVQATKERERPVKEAPKVDRTKKRSERVDDGDVRSEKNKRVKASTGERGQQKGPTGDSRTKLPRSERRRYRFTEHAEPEDTLESTPTIAPARPRMTAAVTDAMVIDPKRAPKRPRDTTPLETQPEEKEPPRKVRRGRERRRVSGDCEKTPPEPMVLEAKDLLGRMAVKVDANGDPQEGNPCSGRKAMEEWSGRTWKMRMQFCIRERLCDVQCIKMGSLPYFRGEVVHAHVWLTDLSYRNAVMLGILNTKTWKITSIEAVLPEAPLNEELLKIGEMITRGWSISAPTHSVEPEASTSNSSTPPDSDHALPSTPPQRVQLLDGPLAPATSIPESGEGQAASLDAVDGHTLEGAENDDYMDVDSLCEGQYVPMDISATPVASTPSSPMRGFAPVPTIYVTQPTPQPQQSPPPSTSLPLLQPPSASYSPQHAVSSNGGFSPPRDAVPVQSEATAPPLTTSPGFQGVAKNDTLEQVKPPPSREPSQPQPISQSLSASHRRPTSEEENLQREPKSLETSFTRHSDGETAADEVQQDSRSSDVTTSSEPTQADPMPSQGPTQSRDSNPFYPVFHTDTASKPTVHRRPGLPSLSLIRSRQPSGNHQLTNKVPHWPYPRSSSSLDKTSPPHQGASASPVVVSPLSTVHQPTAPAPPTASNLLGAQPSTPPQASSSGPLTPGFPDFQSNPPLNGSNSGFTAGSTGSGIAGKAMFGGGRLYALPFASGISTHVAGRNAEASTSKSGRTKHSTPPPPNADGSRRVRDPPKRSWRPSPFDTNASARLLNTPAEPQVNSFATLGPTFSFQKPAADILMATFPPTGPTFDLNHHQQQQLHHQTQQHFYQHQERMQY